MKARIDLQMEADKFKDPYCCEATTQRALMIRHCCRGSLSRDHMASKDALRAKLNKNPVKDTRVAISGSKWTQHILRQGHPFCFWHFGILEVESLHFLRNFTFVIYHLYDLTPSSKKEGLLLTVAKSWKLSSLVLLLGTNPSFDCDNYANADILEALCCLRPNCMSL